MKEWFGDIARCIDKWLQRPSIPQRVDPTRVTHEAIPEVREYDSTIFLNSRERHVDQF